ncbi:hypothetical protein BCR43DRAFT_489572 [Syncephalastrum racemosum]|uniref:Uncharacterized protein n=1 Tax=Syncephalastrum racemosum TaxID=13706 RepID=A0A1X2HEC9_SYNRA|nr:hypothetical protein BCR43DRAFT_489572 [Syncephalastrum racemosum]
MYKNVSMKKEGGGKYHPSQTCIHTQYIHVARNTHTPTHPHTHAAKEAVHDILQALPVSPDESLTLSQEKKRVSILSFLFHTHASLYKPIHTFSFATPLFFILTLSYTHIMH